MQNERKKNHLGTNLRKSDVMQPSSVLPYSKAQKLKGDGEESDMKDGEMLGLVSMLFTDSLKPKLSQALIYYHFTYSSFSLTSSSKIFEVCSDTVQWKLCNLCLNSQYSINMY